MKKISPKVARILAIKHITGYDIPNYANRKEVASYIREHIYGTPQWREYSELFTSLRYKEIEENKTTQTHK